MIELRCTYFPDSRSGQDTSGLKPKGVIHWVSAQGGVPIEVRAYERLFTVPDPSGDRLLEDLNPDSLSVFSAIAEPALVAHEEERFQFERIGYFRRDAQASEAAGKPIYNKTVSLREGF